MARGSGSGGGREDEGQATDDRLLGDSGGGGRGSGGGGGGGPGVEVEIGGAMGDGDLAGVVGGRADAGGRARVEGDRRHGHGAFG